MSVERSRNASCIGPRGQARRRALLDAAAALFVEKGFEKTTLSDILERAGGSRATLYELFGDKDGLFRAMMEESNSRILGEMAACQANSWRTPEEALTQFAISFVKALMDEEGLAVLRILVTEAERIPAVTESFWKIGPETATQRLADYLRCASEKGYLRIEEPTLAARAFIGMITSNMMLQRLVLPHRPIRMEEVEPAIHVAVRLFLDGARPGVEQEGAAA
ncbi:TetR/AcrR family transcriptional regulator [Indioceanicola profundi]|uniref:TetR/AcrR family transcriptional regulator n=1 Tax=Indioceanicola profundi TaxID=2220096 RepID=UPI000E6AB2FF|nr:TetR/AcrR family transcriptional regulator [Indioceanicola profundi]